MKAHLFSCNRIIWNSNKVYSRKQSKQTKCGIPTGGQRHSERTDVAALAGEVWWTATFEVVDVGHTATVVKARIAVSEAWRTVVARHTVCSCTR